MTVRYEYMNNPYIFSLLESASFYLIVLDVLQKSDFADILNTTCYISRRMQYIYICIYIYINCLYVKTLDFTCIGQHTRTHKSVIY